MPTLLTLNALDPKAAEEILFRCCSSKKWARSMALKRPFSSVEEMLSQSDLVWFALDKEDWLEAFSHHPPIGGKSSQKWSNQEQAGVQTASEDVLKKLHKGNIDYQNKFGYVFLVCATGKSAQEMQSALEKRINNNKELELKNAAKEQAQITKIRLKKLLKDDTGV